MFILVLRFFNTLLISRGASTPNGSLVSVALLLLVGHAIDIIINRECGDVAAEEEKDDGWSDEEGA